MEENRTRAPHVLLILAALLLLASALTFLLPAGRFDRVFDPASAQTLTVPGSYAPAEPSPVAPWALPLLVFEAFSTGSAPRLIFFVLFLGGAFELILDTGALSALCARILWRLRRRRTWIIPVFVGGFALLGFTLGLTTASVAFLPLGLAAADALGYDKETGMAMVMLGTNAGFAAGAYNPFSVGIAQTIAELPLYSGAWLRWLMLAVLVPVTALYILRRAGRPAPLREAALPRPAPLSLRQTAVLVLLLGTLALVISGVSLRGWGVPELAAAFLSLGVLSGLAAGRNPNQICALLVSGCRKMTSGALTIGLAAALRLVLTRGGVLDSAVFGLLRAVEGLPGWAHLLGMFYANALLDLLITSGSGHAAAVMPLMVPLADALSLSRQSAVLAFQLGDGLVNLVSPISNTLVSCLALSGVAYPRWLKYFLPLVGIYLAAGTGFLLLAGAAGY